MKTLKHLKGRLALAAAFAFFFAASENAQAHDWGHRHRILQPHYQAPSLYFHRTYHADYLHWTPRRGLHTHGHYHITPHFTPGHFHH